MNTQTILAKRIYRIAKLLKVIAAYDFGIKPAENFVEAKGDVENAISKLNSFVSYFDSVVKTEKQDSSQVHRKLFNIFTMEDTEFNASMSNYQKMIKELSTKCKSILVTALNSKSIDELYLKIYAESSKIYDLISTIEEIEPKLNNIQNSKNRPFVSGAIGNANNFISNLASALGFKNINSFKQHMATKHFNNQFGGIRTSKLRRIRNRRKLAALGIS